MMKAFKVSGMARHGGGDMAKVAEAGGVARPYRAWRRRHDEGC